jgi:hypothetical protein
MADIEPVSREELVLCVCRHSEYRTGDALDAAIFRNELNSSWQKFLRNLNAERTATERDLEEDDNAINEMAELFRYEHDLITAEETEKWLRHRGLTLEDFTDYFSRRYWGTALEQEDAPKLVDLVSASDGLRDLFIAELIFDGELDRLTTRLTWRLAAFSKEDVDVPQTEAEREQFLVRHQISASKVDYWLKQLGRDQDWLEQMLAMEAAYRRAHEKVLTEEARRKQLTLLRMQLTRFEAEVIGVESRDAAKEAFFCIQEDGMSMEEIAAEGRYLHRRITFRHEDIPPGWQQKFWSVGVGDLLEPLERGDGFELYRITRKSEPDLDDRVVQERIDQRLLEQHFSALARENVQMRLEETATE